MKTFYRIEHGVDKYLKTYYLGLYQSSVACNHMNEWGRHIMPWDDVGFNMDVDKILSLLQGRYIFAFPSIKRLKLWVYEREWLEELHRLGYVLSVYECEDGYHGYTQSIFAWEKAQLKHRINLLEV